MDRLILGRVGGVVALIVSACLMGSIPAASAAMPSSPAGFVQEIYRAPAFSEPLVPMGATTVPEDKALLHTLAVYEQRHQATDFAPFAAYLRRYPHSPWAVAIWANEGLVWQARGYYDEAIQGLNKAWIAGRRAHGIAQQSLVDYAVASLARLEARFADVGPLTHLVKAVHGRTLVGASAGLFASGQQSLYKMQHEPQLAFRCGPMALRDALMFLHPRRAPDERLCVAPVTRKGMTLTRLQALAHTVGLPYVMARPIMKAHFPIPSILHWRVNHYATLVGHIHGLYKVWDPGFNHAQWFTRRALLHETTAVLVPKSALKQGFVALSAHQGMQIWGRGYGAPNDPNATRSHDLEVHPQGQPGNHCKCGMAHYSVSALLVSLRISDTPLSYTPPKGPPVRVTFTYNAYDVTQPANFTYGNVGPQWTTNWTSYIEDNIEDPTGNVFRVFPGGGGENETEAAAYGPNDVTYAPEPLTGAQLFKIGAETYKRVLPNGTVQLYSTWNHAAAYPSRIFLTSITGPHGNTVALHYDSQMRLISITDALGQVTTLHYDNPRYPLEITGVTDPFGRTATLTYDSEGRLASTTDPLGITSRYMYRGTSSKIIALTTPYGTTHFQSAIVGNNRILTITDPLGHTEQIQYIQMVGAMPYVDASPPACMALYNAELNLGDTYIWDPTVYAQYPDDFTKAKIYHWMHAQQTDSATPEVEAVKYPLQHWRWYSYPGQTSVARAGTLDKPSAIGVQLGNGKTSLTTLDRNAIGKVAERVSPDGYTTGYTYAANNIDLVKVQQLLVRPQTTPAPTPACPLNLVCSTLTPPDLQGAALDNFSPHPHLQAAVLDNFTPQPHLQPVLLMVPVPPTGSGAGQTCPSNSQYEPIPQGAPVPPEGGLVTLATYTYNNQHEPLTATNASGETTTYTYNAAGQLTSRTDPLGNTTRYVYNSAGYLTSIINPNGQTEASFTYDADGRVASYTNAAGTTVQYTYDALNRLTGITYPDGTSRTYTYQNLNVVAVKNRLNQITHYGYDADGHLTTITSPLGQVTTLTRNADEKVIGITDPSGHTTTWTRDIEERITSRTGPLGHTTIWAYGDGAGRLKSVTDPLGQTTQYSHTLAGRVRGIQFLSVSNPAFPNPPKTIVLGGGAPCLPFPSCLDSDNDSVTFTYGANFPHVVTMTDETGTTHYAYGIIGQPGALRLTNVLAPLPVATVQYQYDADNRVISRSINGIPETYGYDALNRLVSDTNSLGRFSYSYLGPTDLVTRQSLASSPVTIDYHYLPPNQDDRLAAIVNRIGRGSVASIFYQTNALNEVMGIATRPIMAGNGRGLFGSFGGHQGPPVSFGQTFGPFVGRNFGAADLSYDADQRLIGTTGNVFGLTRYTYDDANNLLSVRNRQRSFVGRYNSANEIASANGQSLTYNADGELKTDGAQAFTWNAAHKLVSVTNARAGTITVYMYNGLGERVGTAVWARGASSPVITETLWCGTIVCAAFSPNTAYTAASSPYSHLVAQYFPQGEVDGSQGYLYTRNNIGSVTALVTPQGTVAGQYSYSPYGQMTTSGSTTTPPPIPAFGYAGMVYDHSTGLNLTLYRAYDPQLRRWLSRDPVGFATGINKYAYVNGNPVSWIDPYGLAWQLVIGGGVTVITPFFGGGVNFNVGLNIDGWSSSVYIQDQANVGVGAGAFVGAGLNLALAHADAPTTGLDSEKYLEVDVARGGGLGISVTGNGCGSLDVSGAKGFKPGIGYGVGAFVGNTYTSTAVSPTASSIINAIPSSFYN